MVRYGYCKTCGKEIRPKYGVGEEPPVWKVVILFVLFVVTNGIALLIFLVKRIEYCPTCGNEVVKLNSRDEVAHYRELKEQEMQLRDDLELPDKSDL